MKQELITSEIGASMLSLSDHSPCQDPRTRRCTITTGGVYRSSDKTTTTDTTCGPITRCRVPNDRSHDCQIKLEFFYKSIIPNVIAYRKFAACTVGQMMASVYNQGVHVDRAEVDRLKEIARKAERAGQSLILLPPHRSHIDYVTLQWIFFRLGLSMPLGKPRWYLF
jgi:hypothetical protein